MGGWEARNDLSECKVEGAFLVGFSSFQTPDVRYAVRILPDFSDLGYKPLKSIAQDLIKEQYLTGISDTPGSWIDEGMQQWLEFVSLTGGNLINTGAMSKEHNSFLLATFGGVSEGWSLYPYASDVSEYYAGLMIDSFWIPPEAQWYFAISTSNSDYRGQGSLDSLATMGHLLVRQAPVPLPQSFLLFTSGICGLLSLASFRRFHNLKQLTHKPIFPVYL